MSSELINMADLLNASQEKKTEAFIYNARQVHGDTYNYSKSVYTGSKDKLTITCKQHGDFEQSAKKHIAGQGCPYCSGSTVDMMGLSLEDHYKYTKHYIKENYNFKTKNKYIAYWKDHNKPLFIPASPNNFYKELNFSWPDYLGTSTIHLLTNAPTITNQTFKEEDYLETNQLGNQYLTFEKAKEYIYPLELSRNSWRKWCTEKKRPDFIPVSPNVIYKDYGWSGWTDFFGNTMWTYQKAKEFVHSLNLESMSEWRKYYSKNKPRHLPAAPARHYKEEYISNNDWLGKEGYLPFEKARAFVHTLNLSGQVEWKVYCKSGNKPDNIPTVPEIAYKNKGWQGYSNWVGSSRSRRVLNYPSFKKAREIAQSLNLSGQIDWKNYCKENTNRKLPVAPDQVYADTGWTNWGDFLGTNNKSYSQVGLENINILLSLLKSFRTKFNKLSDADKVNIILQGNAKELLRKLGNANRPELAKISNLDIATNLESLDSAIELLEENRLRLNKDSQIESQEVDTKTSPSSKSKTKKKAVTEIPKIFSMTTWAELLEYYSDSLPTNSVEELISFDVGALMGSEYSIDNEVVKAILDTKVYSLLDKILADSNILKQVPVTPPSNKFSEYILNKFWELYNSANNLIVPEHNWEHQFNLMQKIIAVRLLNEKRLGNFSGVGTGKTASALLASMLIAQKLDKPIVSLIITENNTITGWQKAINEIVPNAVVQINPSFNQHIMFNSSNMNYIIYNYEKFQNYNAKDYVDSILKAKPRLVIIDEIHKIKGGSKDESKRRRYINGILHSELLRKEDRYVLGMSATPLKNKLSEFKSIIESITGERHKDLDFQSTIENACLAHTKVALYAVRCKGKEPVKFTTHTVEIDGKSLVSKIRSAGGNHPSVMSKILLPAKLAKLPDLLRKGTIIYTQFVEEVSSKLVKVVEDAGFTTGVYTGEAEATAIIAGKDITQRQQDLKDYIDDKVDVLIGSSAVATGVDGLQRVTDNLIFITPPFTHADYIQTRGRVVRQGSTFNHIDIHHLCVVIEDADWSWDKSMYGRVEYKRNLGDAVLDGVLPDNVDITAEELTKTSKQSLEKWIDRLQTSGSNTHQRELLVVPLPEELKKEFSNRYGDFRQMNKRITNELSTTTFERFKADPSEWFLYHSYYKELRDTWTEIPIEVIASKITNPDYTVLDMGAGQALLADLLPNNEVIGVDYVSNYPSVIEANMANLNGIVEDKSVDVLVYCLSLMSKHSWIDYLKEGYRCLRDNGVVYICTNASSHTNETMLDELANVGYANSKLVKEEAKFKYYVAYKLPSVW